MIYMVSGALIGFLGLIVQYSGHFYVGFTIFVIGVGLGIIGNRKVHGKR